MTVIIRCDSYEEVSKDLRRAVDKLGGMEKFVRKGNKVLLKPNILLGAHPDRAVTTHPQFVRAVARLVKESGGKVFLGDCPSPSIKLNDALKKCHIYEVCQDEGIEIVPMEKATTIKSKGRIKHFEVSDSVDKMDLIINLPKLKTHSLTTFTGAVKNLYGLIPGFRKLKFHVITPTPDEFSDMLLDLYLGLDKVKLNLMDGIIGMEGNGPFQGRPIKLGIIVASEDALLLDHAAASHVMLESITPLFRLAKKRGLLNPRKVYSEKRPQRIRPPGPTILSRMPKPLYRFFKGFLYKRPVINSKCTRCDACVKICPVKAIKKTSAHPIIDYKACIRCYCCHEICPSNAIDIKR